MELLSIGAFSRIVQISVKALRFYEASGLLAPARVDGQTGYRYYSYEQVPLANTIVTLRSTGMAIADIASAMALDSQAKYSEALRRQHARLLEQRRVIDRQIDLIETLLRAGADPRPYRLIPIDPILALHRSVRAAGAETGTETIASTFEALERAAAEKGARAPSAPFCELLDNGDWRVCVPVSDAAGDDREADFLGGAGIACSVTYAGDYSKTGPALDAMRQWLTDSKLPSAGPAREIYHRFGADQEGYQLPSHVLARDGSRYVTELQLPIEFSGEITT